ncbi:MAG: mechanosensitive ion channel family protein [Chitinophagales bacterium]|nr:mechanosensitive ion channel family protein [Bacteroidota bacterium]MCB9043355.1 mechanosensitive ion channel family protein [Chitinophagales bacterium]
MQDSLSINEINIYLQKIAEMAVAYAPRLLLAAIIFFVGFWAINKLTKIIENNLERANIDKGLRPFLKSLIGIMLKILLLFSIAGIIGVETSSFVALLAASGFAIGLALQGSLSNFAAGILILIFKPFKVGDWVLIEDNEGFVEEIQVFSTLVKSLDHQTIIIPNATAMNGIIRNKSKIEELRVDFTVNLPYDESFDKFEEIAKAALQKVPNVLSEPPIQIGIFSFEDHFLKVAVWVFTHNKDYWQVLFDAQKAVKSAMGENGMDVAYPEGVEKGRVSK